MKPVKAIRTAVAFLLSGIAGSTAYADCDPPGPGLPVGEDVISLYTDAIPKPHSAPLLNKIVKNTVEGLNTMRGSTGLVWDSADVVSGRPATLKGKNTNTSPTNIGLDLLIQTELAKRPGKEGKKAQAILEAEMATLQQVPKYEGANHGILFFDWYATDRIHVDDKDKDVSAVDNINLAVAIWTVAKTFPDQRFGQRAQDLFNHIDFSPFYHEKTGLAGGNLKFDGKNSWALEIPKPEPPEPGEPVPPVPTEPWDYGDFGSESRSIYSLGYALGLFKNESGTPEKDAKFLSRAIDALHMELYPSKSGNVIRVWDGGAFQTLLPDKLVNEGAYSKTLGESSETYGPLTLALGKTMGLSLPGKKGPIPLSAAFSASQSGPASYNGLAGLKALATTWNHRVCKPVLAEKWQQVYTLHAVALAAGSSDPDTFAPQFEGLMSYQDQSGNHVFNKHIGFSDGISVEGSHKGDVVPTVLSLDNEMLALSLMQARDSNSGPSASALANDPGTRRRLQVFYQAVDRKYATVTPTAESPCKPGDH